MIKNHRIILIVITISWNLIILLRLFSARRYPNQENLGLGSAIRRPRRPAAQAENPRFLSFSRLRLAFYPDCDGEPRLFLIVIRSWLSFSGKSQRNHILIRIIQRCRPAARPSPRWEKSLVSLSQSGKSPVSSWRRPAVHPYPAQGAARSEPRGSAAPEPCRAWFGTVCPAA